MMSRPPTPPANQGDRPVKPASRLTPPRIAAAIAGGLTMVVALSLLSVSLMAEPKTAASGQVQETLVRLNGSPTMGSKLALELATAWAKQNKLPGIRIDAGADPNEYDVVAEGAESARRLRVQIRTKSTLSGLEPLLRGQADIWMAVRPAKESDLEVMRKRGVPNVPTLAQFQQPGTENVIGLAALAIIVNPKNPVPSLSVSQLRDIFTGNATSWAQVGGPSNLPIGVYSPEVGLVTLEVFCSSIMGIADQKMCADGFPRLAAPRFAVLEDIPDAVAGNPAGIGFIDLSMKRNARPVPLADECGGGADPSVFRIKTDEYPLGRRMYFYIAPGRAQTPAAKDFLQFALGPVGQAAVSAAGFANLEPSNADPDYGNDRLDNARDALDGGRTRVRAPDAKAFETAIAGADRLSITFRFQAGTDDLDSRAVADVARLAALMQTPAYKDATVSLIGYSSTTGDYVENRALSKDRANAVRDRLIAAGIQNVTAVGVGPTAAVACNLDPSTALLNQRVEVWIHKPRSS
jgi:phosphate transport system substrate-binding protein